MSWVGMEAFAEDRTPGLNLSARLVMFALAHHHNHKTGACYPGHAAIAATGKVGERSVRSAIEELVQAGLIRVRQGGGPSFGGRPTDAYDLVFVDAYRRSKAAAAAGKDFPAGNGDFPANGADFPAAAAAKQREQTEHIPPNPPEGGRRSRSKAEVSPEAKAVADRLWRLASRECRRKSGQDDTARATAAALARGATPDELAVAVLGHCQEKAAEDGGKWTKGLHRILEQDRWRAWYPDDARQVQALLAAERRLIAEDDPDAPPADDLGTLDAPGLHVQRVWMQDWVEAPYKWQAHVRGPAPGEEGCRVSAEVQREFGAVPFGEAA